ncbi:MAG: hypothetical protein KA292_02005, partial [Sphingorhabdus sp.]|nr:hypothetical protein [Sphingorhabdus sp.]
VTVVSALLAIFMHHFCFVAVHNNESGGGSQWDIVQCTKNKIRLLQRIVGKAVPGDAAGDSLGDACFMRLRR